MDGGLGFRDFETFNLALLAKQGWRLIHNEESLCQKVLKGKYFPNGSILEAALGHNPSYLWLSLMESRRVVIDGVKVGDWQC